MAKQTSLIKINGKADGQSFYTSKNGGALMRSINKGMSARVKEAKEYINTRKNNAEFGMAGDVAGAIIKPISMRWRFILSAIATGLMVKELRSVINQDSTHPWGQRVFGAAKFDIIREKFNSLSKNPMLEEIAAVLSQNVGVTPTTCTLDDEPILSIDRQAELIAQGINHLDIQYFALKTTVPTYDSAIGSYGKAVSSLVLIDELKTSVDLTATAPVVLAGATTGSGEFTGLDDDSEFGGVLAVCLPGRKVGGVVSVLQEHCSAYLAKCVESE